MDLFVSHIIKLKITKAPNEILKGLLERLQHFNSFLESIDKYKDEEWQWKKEWIGKEFFNLSEDINLNEVFEETMIKIFENCIRILPYQQEDTFYILLHIFEQYTTYAQDPCLYNIKNTGKIQFRNMRQYFWLHYNYILNNVINERHTRTEDGLQLTFCWRFENSIYYGGSGQSGHYWSSLNYVLSEDEKIEYQVLSKYYYNKFNQLSSAKNKRRRFFIPCQLREIKEQLYFLSISRKR